MDMNGGQIVAGWMVLMTFGLLLVRRFFGPAGMHVRIRRHPSVVPIPAEKRPQRGVRNYE
jgi:hypothetical protein